MRNPFRYGGVVTGDDFCNRTREQDDLIAAVRNSDKLFLYGERRLGKTSLVRQVLSRVPAADCLSIYVDLLPTDSESSFALALARAVAEAAGSTADREPDLEATLEAPARIAEAERTGVVVVFDGFQQILRYGSDRIERTIRSVIQHHDRVGYLFLGSRRHLIQGMFLDASKPLYRSAGHYPLEPIGLESWRPFITDRFRTTGKSVSDPTIDRLVSLTGGHPFYTQHLCNVLWERTEAGREALPDMIDPALETLLRHEGYGYTALWEGMTMNQQRFLKGLAAEPGEVVPFSAPFIARFGLKSPSNVQRASTALLEQDIINRDHGSFIIVDRFFRIWVRRLMGI